MFSDLIWGAPEWAWPALAIGAVLAIAVLWAYLRSTAAGGVKAACRGSR